jgi:hypothetical protein
MKLADFPWLQSREPVLPPDGRVSARIIGFPD